MEDVSPHSTARFPEGRARSPPRTSRSARRRGLADQRELGEVHVVSRPSESAQYLQVSAVNQLWVADITYVLLGREFVYLAVVLDVYSRRVVGWSLGRSLQAQLPLAALRSAIASRQPGRGLVHHSDRMSLKS